MCLGIPGEILEIDGTTARAEFWNVEKEIRLDIVGDTVSEGDYILNHAGFAIRKIPDEEVAETKALYESLLAGDEEDALEEIGSGDATLEFGDRPAAEADGPTATTDRLEQRTGGDIDDPDAQPNGPATDPDE